jgi:hypothetical protein
VIGGWRRIKPKARGRERQFALSFFGSPVVIVISMLIWALASWALEEWA